MFENDFSSWLLMHTRHPINLAYSTSHYYESALSNGLIDVRTVALSTSYLIFASGGRWCHLGWRVRWASQGQRGPDAAVFLREWQSTIDVQFGCGSSHTSGTAVCPKL